MIQKAKNHYGKDFEELFKYYLENGIVYIDNQTFIMAMYHNKDILLGRKKLNKLDKCDCYFVHYFYGNLKRLFEVMPIKLEYAVFERFNGKLKVYNLERIRGKIYGIST
mgnify:CR=1 FL=1